MQNTVEIELLKVPQLKNWTFGHISLYQLQSRIIRNQMIFD